MRFPKQLCDLPAFDGPFGVEPAGQFEVELPAIGFWFEKPR